MDPSRSLPAQRDELEQVRALLMAARVAAMNTPGLARSSVLCGAPSHSGARLLSALKEAGWELRRTDA